MPWETSSRTSRLPPDWRAIRKRVLERDGQRCTRTLNGVRCTLPATDVHHRAGSENHDDANLVSLCAEHHNEITKQQSAAARWRYKNQRQPEPHPGLNR